MPLIGRIQKLVLGLGKRTFTISSGSKALSLSRCQLTRLPIDIWWNDKNLFVRNVVFWAFFTAPSSRLHYFWALASKKKKRKRGVGNFAFWLSFVLIWVWFVALIILTWRLQSTLKNRQKDTFFWNYHYLYFKTLQKASAFWEKLFWPSQPNLVN